jgi:hypothetical protein
MGFNIFIKQCTLTTKKYPNSEVKVIPCHLTAQVVGGLSHVYIDNHCSDNIEQNYLQHFTLSKKVF